MNDVRIEAHPYKTLIYVDGKPINGITYFKVEQDVGMEVPVLTLKLLAKEIFLNGVSIVEVDKNA